MAKKFYAIVLPELAYTIRRHHYVTQFTAQFKFSEIC